MGALSAEERPVIGALVNEVRDALENKIKEAVNSCNNVRALLKQLDSKRYTQSRIQRILLYALFGITKKQMADSKKILSPYTVVTKEDKKKKYIIMAVIAGLALIGIITYIFISNQHKNDFINETISYRVR